MAIAHELEAFYLRLEATIEGESPNINEHGVVRKVLFQDSWRLDVAHRDLSKLGNPQLRETMAVETVNGMNSRYAFRIFRKSSDSPYLVRYCGKDGSSWLKVVEDRYTKSVFAPWCIRARPLRQWVTTNGFKIESVEPITVDGNRYARAKVMFATDKESREEEDVSFAGDLLMDPERYWLIAKANLVLSFRYSDGAVKSRRYTRDIEFGPSIKGMPIPRNVFHVFEVSSSLPHPFKEKWTISNVVQRSAGEHEFTLGAFGLPEIFEDAPGQPKSRLWLWLIGLGVLVALGAVYVLWIQRGRAKASAE